MITDALLEDSSTKNTVINLLSALYPSHSTPGM
jgi:hypothetical protein